jgi:hypothetical protein
MIEDALSGILIFVAPAYPHSPPLQRKLIDKIYTKKINPRGKGVGGSVFLGGPHVGGGENHPI